MSEEDKEKKTPTIPTYAPTEEEMQAEGAAPSTPETYPLFKKMDGIKASIDALTAEVKNAVTALNKIVSNTPALGAVKETPKTTKPAEQPATSPKTESGPSKLEEVMMAFSEDLETLLYFEEKGDYIIVKPRQFLGSENFAKIASAIRGLGGEYISAGKDSHFRVKT